MTNNLGVFYTCFTEKKAVEYSLHELFKHYPNIPVYLVSDGGSDYSFLKERFPNKNIETKLEEDTRGIIAVIDRNISKKGHPRYSNENMKPMLYSIEVFLRRINDAIEYCNSEYLLIMEPDVLVRGKLNINQNDKLLGSKLNPIKSYAPKLCEYMKNYKGAIEVTNYGCTPALFKTSEFKKILELLKKDTGLIERTYRMFCNFPYYDALLAVLFGYIGVEEKFNPDITECFRDRSWQTNNKPLLHQFRKYYPSKEEHNSVYSTIQHNILTNSFKQ